MKYCTILQKITKFGSESCEKMAVAFSKSTVGIDVTVLDEFVRAFPGAISMAQTQKSDEINVKNVTGRLFWADLNVWNESFVQICWCKVRRTWFLDELIWLQGESNTFSRIQNWLKLNEFGRISGNCNEICRQRFTTTNCKPFKHSTVDK